MNTIVKGIVINRYKVANNDVILTIFTEELGKIKVYANGARSIKSQLAVASQQLVVAEFQVALKKDLHKLSSAYIEYAHLDIRENIDRLFVASYILELIDLTIPLEVQETQIYEMLIYALKILEKIEEKKLLKIFRISFSLKLIKLLGYEMSLFRCSNCGRSDKLKTVISYDYGGVLCSECMRKSKFENYTINHVKILNILLNKPFSDIHFEDINDIILSSVDDIVIKYIEKNIVDRKIKSVMFLDGI